MSDMDWGAEVRKLEREFVGLPPEPTAGALKARQNAERRAQEHRDAVKARIGATARLVLVASLAGALYFWPYARECGSGLFAYMAAEALIGSGALWVVAFTWRHRLARAHAVAFLMLLGALALLAAEVLPRVGYARADPTHLRQWWCVPGSR